MKIGDILKHKGAEVHDIQQQVSLADVVATLVEKNCGSLLVRDNDKVVGIITERDILRACHAEDRPLSEIKAQEKMSTGLITGQSGDTVSSVMGLLTQHRIRHLPIVDNDQLVGIISIGDVVKAQHDQLATENQFLKNYIQG